MREKEGIGRVKRRRGGEGGEKEGGEAAEEAGS